MSQAAGHAGEEPSYPHSLRDTGLYADFASHAVEPEILSYAPQYGLWSDGAAKRRWIYLPPGAAIDATDPDVWLFPAGAKIWKEFSFHGRRVETRLLVSRGPGVWQYGTYVWNADETDAVLAPTGGVRGVADLAPGVRHDIPGVYDCRACHRSRVDEALGFSALQLSADRDPHAVHFEPLQAGMATLPSLIARGLLRNDPREWATASPRLDAAGPTARAALGYLHANCGNCHNPNASADALTVQFRHLVNPRAAGEPALRTAVNQPGLYRIPGLAGDSFLIRPGDPARSTAIFRMATRDPYRQMPPLGTKLVDVEALQLLRRWIQEDLVR